MKSVLEIWLEKLEKSKIEGFSSDISKIQSFILHIKSNYPDEKSNLNSETFMSIRKFIALFLTCHLKHFREFPLHEAFYFDQHLQIVNVILFLFLLLFILFLFLFFS